MNQKKQNQKKEQDRIFIKFCRRVFWGSVALSGTIYCCAYWFNFFPDVLGYIFSASLIAAIISGIIVGFRTNDFNQGDNRNSLPF